MAEEADAKSMYETDYRDRVWCVACGKEQRKLGDKNWPICCDQAMLRGCKGSIATK